MIFASVALFWQQRFTVPYVILDDYSAASSRLAGGRFPLTWSHLTPLNEAFNSRFPEDMSVTGENITSKIRAWLRDTYLTLVLKRNADQRVSINTVNRSWLEPCLPRPIDPACLYNPGRRYSMISIYPVSVIGEENPHATVMTLLLMTKKMAEAL